MTTDPAMSTGNPNEAAIRELIAASGQVGRVSGRQPWREVLQRVTGGRWPRPRWPVVPHLATPWQDTVSAERPGWRMRAAHLRGRAGDAEVVRDDFVFEVDYQLCRTCRIGWVEQPHTLEPYRRRGLAAAGLAALRAENPGFAWHTLGGHIDGSPAFWDTVGAGVPGGYRPRRLCEHVTAGA
ncbi:hypothetical protein [Phytohabitans aurantiacus]|nr:hypothetical protein [Phytohabitans aurantiacus]